MHCPATITRFRSLRQVQGERLTLSSWGALINRPILAERKQDLPGWSPATFEGDSRADGHVAISLSALVIEHDDGTKLQDFDDLWAAYERIVYTTWSHTETNHKFRCVLPLTRPITPDEHAVLWRWAEVRGIAADQYIDPQTKDAKRFWFAPGSTGSKIWTWRRRAKTLDPDEVLAVEAVARATDPRYVIPLAAPAPTVRGDVVSRARAYLAKVPGAVAGQQGHLCTWRTAVALVRGFALEPHVALELLKEWNVKCEPAWSEKDLCHKIRQASVSSKVELGYLLDRPMGQR